MQNRANRLLMQFHITGKCNLNCKHCYREEGNVQPLSFGDIKSIINQYNDLRLAYNEYHGINKKGHINITGGEPLIRDDIYEILDFLGENRKNFSFGILSNGSPVNEKMIKSFNKNHVSFVQLSIDGNKKTHDYLRGVGDYDRTIKTACLLENHDIKTYISFTANKINYKQLSKVAKQLRRVGVHKLWSDRLVPVGGCDISNLAITKEILPEYIKSLKKAQGSFIEKRLFPETKVTMDRALQFLNNNTAIYSCSAADSLITVDEFGRVMPCRRMPVICGDVFYSTLKEIYFNNPHFLALRLKKIPEECINCVYNVFCRGGARCQSYAIYSDYTRADPACPNI